MVMKAKLEKFRLATFDELDIREVNNCFKQPVDSFFSHIGQEESKQTRANRNAQSIRSKGQRTLPFNRTKTDVVKRLFHIISVTA